MACEGCPVGPGCRGEVASRLCELQLTDPSMKNHLKKMAGIDLDVAFDPHPPLPPPAQIAEDRILPNGIFSEKKGSVPRVGLLTPCLNQGGGEAWGYALIKSSLRELNWVGVVCLDPIEKTNAVMVEKMGELVPIQFGREKIRELALHCDVLVSWIIEQGVNDEGAKPPIIWVDHFAHDEEYNSVVQKCIEGSAHIVAVSEVCLPGVPLKWKSKTSIIWNAVDADRLTRKRSKPSMRSIWNVPPEAKVAGFYSRMDQGKRPDAMIRLASHLPNHWHVVMVGEAHIYPDQMRKMARALSQLEPSVRKRIHILPPDHASGDVLGAFDVLVNPAEVESFGLTTCEALWVGTPTVATLAGMAKLHPELVYEIGLDASGEELARVVLEADAGGPRPGSEAFARTHFSEKRFESEWTSLIRSVAGLAPAYPSLPAQAMNFAHASMDHISSGFEGTEPKEEKRREGICDLCPFFVRAEARCEKCGCNLAVKRGWATSSCPEGKW